MSKSDTADLRIASAADLSGLAGEHPAVIARVLSRLSRVERIAVLRGLPGHTARAALRWLRAD